jgi:uncharacterized protein with LGFP repeats
VSDAEQAAWSSVVQGLVFNEQTAICAYWRELKAGGTYIGVPVSNEVPDGNGVAMSFSSGAIIHWDAEGGSSLQ